MADVFLHELRGAGTLAVGLAPDVTRDRRRRSPTVWAAPVWQHANAGAVPNGSGPFVEPEGASVVVVFGRLAGYLGENVGEVELEILALAAIPEHRFEAPRVLFLRLIRSPMSTCCLCMDRSGMRGSRGGKSSRAELRNCHGCEPRLSRLRGEVGRCPFREVIAAWRAL
jgi:hypothetical protein